MIIQSVSYGYPTCIFGMESKRFTFPYLSWTDDPGVRHVVKHFRTNPNDPQDIRSYADLQQWSAKVTPSIGMEKPFFHIREDIELGVTPSVPFDAPLAPNPVSYVYYAGRRWGPPCWRKVSNKECISAELGYNFEYGRRAATVTPTLSLSQAGPLKHENGFYDLYARGASMTFGSYRVEIPYYSYQGDQLAALAYEASKAFESFISVLRAHVASMEYSVYAHLRDTLGPKWSRSTEYFYVSTLDSADQFDPFSDYQAFRDDHTEPPGLYPRLCAEALRDTTVDSNMIANGLDLFDLAASIKSGKFISGVLSNSSLFRRSSEAWLAYRYSYSTSKSDISSLLDYQSSRNKTIARAAYSDDKGLMHVKLSLSPPEDKVNALASKLTEYGVAPNLYNIWDLIPFSFVVDWFLDFGDLLDEITGYGRVSAYHINYITSSWKWVEEFDRGHSSCKLTVYNRQVSPTAPPYVPYLESHTSDSTIVKRMVDAVALFGGNV